MAVVKTIWITLSGALCFSVNACPQETSNPMLSAVTSISPECFKACPQMCEPLDHLVAEYQEKKDANAVKAKVCAAPQPFTCMFEPEHFGFCKKVLEAGTKFGVHLPMSTQELDAECGSSGTPANTTSGNTTTHHNNDLPVNTTMSTTVLHTSAATNGFPRTAAVLLPLLLATVVFDRHAA